MTHRELQGSAASKLEVAQGRLTEAEDDLFHPPGATPTATLSVPDLASMAIQP